MGYFSKVLTELKSTSAFLYTGINEEDLTGMVNEFFHTSGYMVKFEKDKFVTYEKGNPTLMQIFGAPHAYFRFSVAVSKIDRNACQVTVIRSTSGSSGGAIGRSQVEDEFSRIKIGLSTF
ncbi:hypothetical protein [Pinibacter soli]|uniref:DUF4783 domain-containing protein n=1 Tax=Pinibacter soli TaxID=3044211 RepID=A0ABT6RBM7_9BACT|nr:hypothetical protein [Pinibacter soli]MDI3319930.1 hypothetical protein [Pinibacter soli]